MIKLGAEWQSAARRRTAVEAINENGVCSSVGNREDDGNLDEGLRRVIGTDT
jgi:hypothetical protein